MSNNLLKLKAKERQQRNHQHAIEELVQFNQFFHQKLDEYFNCVDNLDNHASETTPAFETIKFSLSGGWTLDTITDNNYFFTHDIDEEGTKTIKWKVKNGMIKIVSSEQDTRLKEPTSELVAYEDKQLIVLINSITPSNQELLVQSKTDDCVNRRYFIHRANNDYQGLIRLNQSFYYFVSRGNLTELFSIVTNLPVYSFEGYVSAAASCSDYVVIECLPDNDEMMKNCLVLILK